MPRGGGAGGSKRTSSIQFQRPEEPSFLKKLKEQVGYKEQHAVREQDEGNDAGEDIDRDDEKPQVVVLEDGHLTADQALLAQEQADIRQGKMVFRKPSGKRPASEVITTHRKTSLTKIDDKQQLQKQQTKKKKKADTSLLSFGNEVDVEDNID